MVGRGQLLLEKVFQLLLMDGNKLPSSQRLVGANISNLALVIRHLDRPLVGGLVLPGLKLRAAHSHQNAIDVVPGWGTCLGACLKHAHDLARQTMQGQAFDARIDFRGGGRNGNRELTN